MDFFHFFDLTSLVIVAPLIVLFSFLFVAAVQKRCLPWPISRDDSPHLLCTSEVQPSQTQPANFHAEAKELRPLVPAYLLGLGLGTAVFSVLFASGLIVIHTEPLLSYPNLLAILWAGGLSVFIPVPIFAIYQLIVFGRKPIPESKKSEMQFRYIVGLIVFTAFLMLSIPLAQYLLSVVNMNAVPVRLIQNAFRLGLAFTAIPLSICGVAIAFYGSSVVLTGGSVSAHIKNYRLLKNPSFHVSQLEGHSEDDLQDLIHLAVRTRNIKVADEISAYLLQRVESDHELSTPLETC